MITPSDVAAIGGLFGATAACLVLIGIAVFEKWRVARKNRRLQKEADEIFARQRQADYYVRVLRLEQRVDRLTQDTAQQLVELKLKLEGKKRR